MGRHAFIAAPEHRLLYEARGVGDEAPLLGLAERWNMPAVRHRLPLEEASFPGVDHFVLTIHIGGSAVRRLDLSSRPVTAKKGAVSLQHPGDPIVIESIGGLVDYGHLYFRRGLIVEVAEELGIDDGSLPAFFGRNDPDLARDVGLYMRRASDAADPAPAIEMDSRAYLIGLALFRICRERAVSARQEQPVLRHDLRKALALVEDEMDGPLRLSDLAEATGLSPFHFARVFRASLGEAPAAYLMRRRTEKAVELIQGTDLPLGVIAFRTGFSSQSHMTRRVKALTGSTPQRLRE